MLMSSLHIEGKVGMTETHKVQARALQRGDITGSGETVVGVSAGIRTPRGRIEITLEKDGRRRTSIWGAYTMINVRRPEKTA